MKKSIAVLSLLLISSSAFADICGIVTESQAAKTLSFLKKGTILEMTFSDQPRVKVSTISIEKSALMGGVEYYDLKINGESIDPGHTNIIINSKVSLNLGRLVGCDKDASDPDIISETPIKNFMK